MTAPIHGWNDPRFDAVRDAFATNFAEHGDVGARSPSTCTASRSWTSGAAGTPLDREREWDRNTLVNVASTTKGLAAFCAHRLAEQGRLDFDAPVSDGLSSPRPARVISPFAGCCPTAPGWPPSPSAGDRRTSSTGKR